MDVSLIPRVPYCAACGGTDRNEELDAIAEGVRREKDLNEKLALKRRDEDRRLQDSISSGPPQLLIRGAESLAALQNAQSVPPVGALEEASRLYALRLSEPVLRGIRA